MKEELKKIINELKEVVIEEKLNILDKDLLEFSIRIMNTTYITINSKKNLLKNELSPKEMLEPNSNDGLATSNQKNALRKAKIEFPADISKREAWLLLNNKFKKKNEQTR